MRQEINRLAKSPSDVDRDFYPIIVQRRGNFCVYLPEWKISGEGATLEEAFRQYEVNKKATEERLAKFELATVTPEPYPTIKMTAVLQDLILYLVKAASSAFVVILVVVLLLPNIGAALKHQIRGLVPLEPKFWAIQFPSQLNARLDRLKPEEEEQMRNEWNRLLERTLPIWSPLTNRLPEKAKPDRP